MADQFRLVIDPGHGGDERSKVGGSSGNNATGPAPRSLKEKDLTLKVARLLRERLRKDCEVILTRDGDVNLSLASRAEVARKNKADLFLSIHFNGFADTAIDGTETWVARKASERSRRFAQALLTHLTVVTGVANRGVREANFGVLLPIRHDANTTACLAEIAFLTNPTQARRLEDSDYLGKIADALASAVRGQMRVASQQGVEALWDPDPVDDERYAGGRAATAGLAYASPLEEVVRTVVDADAHIRTGAPDLANHGHQKIPQWTKVRVDATNGKYSQVTGLDGKAYGWTATSNLAAYFKDDPALASASLAPVTPIAIDASWSAKQKAVAGAFNRLGGLMQVVATQTRIEVAAVLAVWFVESAGRTHTVNQAIIRFENHLLFDRWGSEHPADFDAHFQFGTRAPATGDGCDKRWKCHTFRAAKDGEFENVHANQASEYRALAVATKFAGETDAIQCISIGGSQILGSHYRRIGYATPRQMYDAFQAGERAHVLGFFDYCQFVQSGGALLTALRSRDWRPFATGYNGSSRVDQYSTDLENAYQAAVKVLATRPAGAQALEVALANMTVDLSYPVDLIPQPDKLSCWAASMAMLLVYRRNKVSLTPEFLAREVGRSLRTSYSWDMLKAVRQHYQFKEVSLPSNLSFVPPPADWHQWLEQFGPLWVTVAGNPSHAIVVHGISGDLTPAGTHIRLLNPWDDRVKFDDDPIDFHPANQGHADTYRFEEFARLFGTMGLSDYGHWRVLYLGRRSAEVQSLADIDLPPEALFDAEPPLARAKELDVALAAPRPALHAADARWAADDQSIDYRHLGVAGQSQAFTFTPAMLERLCRLNRFDVAAGQDQVLFALRGCSFVEGRTSGGFVASVKLTESEPDHKTAQCVLGVWKRSTGQFSLFTGSTVPNWVLMEGFRQGGDHANMLPTGRYMFRVGSHRAGTPSEVPGAFLQSEPFVVLRTLDDLIYKIGDIWDDGQFGDNIQPARLDGRAKPPFFSSAGCQTIPGNVKDGSHTGSWADFRAAAGLSANSPASENGRRFVYVMLTGREARLASAGSDDRSLTRLRFGSSGVDVTAIQLRLKALGHLGGAGKGGLFDAATKMAYLAFQRARSAATADGVVTPSDAAALGADILAGRSIAIAHGLEEVGAYELGAKRAATNDEIVAQFDSQQGTKYGDYAGYRAALTSGTVFGHLVNGVTPGFLAKLKKAETAAAAAMGNSNFGLRSVGGYRASSGMHNWGLAIDINYEGLPFIMHEQGEAVLDRELGPIYTRIACLMLHRDSVIPGDITKGSRSASRTSTLYDRLLEESNAMIRYFGIMPDITLIAKAISAVPAGFDWKPVTGSASALDGNSLQDLMMADYVNLSGRDGPAISGKTYPKAKTIKRSGSGRADRPFETSKPSLRAPELGYMNIRKEIVVALSGVGLRWGAVDFGGESGDVMHFDDRLGEGAKIDRAKKAALDAIAAGSQSLQANPAGCAPDVPVDDHVALIFSNEAPLASLPDCDHSAVWTYTPDPNPSKFSVLFYFHGNDACVTVDAQHPGGRLPSWNKTKNPNLHQFTPNGPFTPGLKYDIAGAVQSSKQKPVVLIPEVGVAGGWAKTNAGTLGPDQAALSRLIDDAWGHLARLNKPTGSPYLSSGPRCPNIKRLFLAGHSGGGKALGPSAASYAASHVPTDLWLLDCTYHFGIEQHYIDFVRKWKSQGKLGNDAQSSRMVVIVWTASEATTAVAGDLLQRLRASWRDANGAHPGLNAVRFSQHKFCPMTGSCPAAGITPPTDTEIVEVMSDASWSEVEKCLSAFPVVFVHTGVPHDEIPLRYIPHLLSTAADP